MDKENLELLLIDMELNPKDAQSISALQVRGFIPELIERYTKDALFFNGPVIVVNKDISSTSQIELPSLIIRGGSYDRSLRIDFFDGEDYIDFKNYGSVTVNGGHRKYSWGGGDESFKLTIRSAKSFRRYETSMYIKLPQIADTEISTIPTLSEDERNTIFWKTIAKQLGLKVENKDGNEQYLRHKHSPVTFKVGSGWGNDYAIVAYFPKKVDAKQLTAMVKDLPLDPEYLDGCKISESFDKHKSIPHPGKEFTVSVDRGLGSGRTVKSYLTRALQIQS